MTHFCEIVKIVLFSKKVRQIETVTLKAADDSSIFTNYFYNLFDTITYFVKWVCRPTEIQSFLGTTPKNSKMQFCIDLDSATLHHMKMILEVVKQLRNDSKWCLEPNLDQIKRKFWMMISFNNFFHISDISQVNKVAARDCLDD